MLGRNKITKIEGLNFVSKLDVLDLHNNEITEIGIYSIFNKLMLKKIKNNYI